jgi:hypothetical protein
MKNHKRVERTWRDRFMAGKLMGIGGRISSWGREFTRIKVDLGRKHFET